VGQELEAHMWKSAFLSDVNNQIENFVLSRYRWFHQDGTLIREKVADFYCISLRFDGKVLRIKGA
jgi:hypothetical protein